MRLVRGGQLFDLLSLSVSRTGNGMVTSTDGRITCPEACSATFAEATPVTLTATPDPGWDFTGWGGACTGTSDCTLSVDGPLSVTANFTQAANRYQLDSPVNGSFESGIGIAYGWVCDASQVALQIDEGASIQAAYGAERIDSQATCGDTANGFAAVINWNNHGDGDHMLKLLADSQALTQAQVTVTTLGEEFLRGASASTTVADFPATGLSTPLAWSEPHQNFVVTNPAAARAAAFAPAAVGQAHWESPQAGAFESGRALIRGWACEATSITATLDGGTLTVPYGGAREDTRDICGDTDNGYALAINWNDQGDGDHQIALAIDGQPVAARTFQIATPGGQGTVSGVQSRHDVSDFPHPGDSLTLQWSEPHQNYRLIAYTPATTPPRDTVWRVSELYITTLGYAPDNEGLHYWTGNIDTDPDWTPTTVAQSFFDQPLVQEHYPADQPDAVLIEALYQNLFGRGADAEGLAYWQDALGSGRMARNQMVVALIEGGWANAEAAADMTGFGHRIEVGLAFAAYQADHGIEYSQLSDTDQAALRQAGRDVLATVTADPVTREVAIESIPALLESLAN